MSTALLIFVLQIVFIATFSAIKSTLFFLVMETLLEHVNRVSSESNHLSPILRAISLNMAVKKNCTKPIDPSNFLWALKRSLSSTRVTPFDFNSQQDVAEILQVVLDELKGVSLAASSLISNTLRTTVSCDTCLCSSVSEENLDMNGFALHARLSLRALEKHVL